MDAVQNYFYEYPNVTVTRDNNTIIVALLDFGQYIYIKETVIQRLGLDPPIKVYQGILYDLDKKVGKLVPVCDTIQRRDVIDLLDHMRPSLFHRD